MFFLSFFFVRCFFLSFALDFNASFLYMTLFFLLSIPPPPPVFPPRFPSICFLLFLFFFKQRHFILSPFFPSLQSSFICVLVFFLAISLPALVDGKGKHIPYRDSKLTRLLQVRSCGYPHHTEPACTDIICTHIPIPLLLQILLGCNVSTTKTHALTSTYTHNTTRSPAAGFPGWQHQDPDGGSCESCRLQL